MSGIFGGLNKARTAQGGNYLAAGQYIAEVRKFAKTTSKAKGDAPVVAIELAIVKVEVAYEAEGDFKASNKEGEAVSHVIVFDGSNRDTKLSNLKNFVAAALDIHDPDGPEGADVDYEAAAEEFAKGDGTSLRGTRLQVSVGKIKTKAGRPFCPVRYRPIVANPAAKAA